MFFCEQMFLIKTGNEYTCESAIYTYQNSKLIQQKCDIEYYPELNPEPLVLNLVSIYYLEIFLYHGTFAQR